MAVTYVTFISAYIGYLFLAVTMLAHHSRIARPLKWSILAAIVIVNIHVFLIWWVRYDFVPHEALRNGIGTAIIFHMLCLAIMAHCLLYKRHKFFMYLIYPI